MGSNRNRGIDFLKGVAIMAVFLYHSLGEFFQFGYLGVDIFLVIAGYFMIQHFEKVSDWNFKFCWNYIYGRLIRIYPLTVALCILSLVVGYFLMLPDDYENLSESVVATSVFANNVLAAITTHNYWNTVNLYKSLMHTWYLGVLVQMYLFVTLVIFLVARFTNELNKREFLKKILICMCVGSFILYVLPCFSFDSKFYYFPFRIFEFALGGIVFAYRNKLQKTNSLCLCQLMLICLFLVLFGGYYLDNILGKNVLAICTATITAYCLLHFSYNTEGMGMYIIQQVGVMSFSVFIWHQFVIAFVRYSVVDRFDCFSFLILTIVVAVISWLSYEIFELRLNSYMIKKTQFFGCASNCVVGLSIFCVGMFLFFRAGVVRDVPELNVTMHNFKRGMHIAYCDRIYALNKEFSKDGAKKKILVIGNSFGRDWANILLESPYGNEIEISYLFSYSKKDYEKHRQRFLSADRIFYAMGPGYNDVTPAVFDYIDPRNLYIIGNKWYGWNNGLIYGRRFQDNYFEQKVQLPREFVESNTKYRHKYGERYIDMMEPVTDDNNWAKVFTDDKKYISQDCEHLTQSGAKFYARIFDIKMYLGL